VLQLPVESGGVLNIGAFPKLQFLEDKRSLSSDLKFRSFARLKA
jgi:hypothetical protein